MKTDCGRRMTMKSFLMAVFLLCAPLVISACDLCGAYVGVLPFDNRNSFGITHRYRVFNGYATQGQQSQFFPTGAYRLPANGNYSPLHGGMAQGGNAMAGTDYESFKVVEGRVRYFIAPRVEVNLIVPFMNNKQNALGQKSAVFGLGDITLYSSYHLVQKQVNEVYRHRFVTGLGIKLPTGANDLRYDNDDDRLPLMIQPGTGSVDALIILSYSCAWGGWRAGVTATGKLNGRNGFHEQVLPSESGTVLIAYQYEKGNCIILPQFQVFQEYTRGVRSYDYVIPGTGMNMVMAGPGIDIVWNKFDFHLCVQAPVYQDVFEMNMKVAGRFMLGISYNLEAKKYILN